MDLTAALRVAPIAEAGLAVTGWRDLRAASIDK